MLQGLPIMLPPPSPWCGTGCDFLVCRRPRGVSFLRTHPRHYGGVLVLSSVLTHGMETPRRFLWVVAGMNLAQWSCSFPKKLEPGTM